MRVLLRILGVATVIVALGASALTAWFYFSTAGLPDPDALRAYAPMQRTLVPAGSCRGSIQAFPAAELTWEIPALVAAEGHQGRMSFEIARGMFCGQDKQLSRELKELRLALQIRRQFSEEEQEVILANRVWMGGNQPGVESAAEKFFGVDAAHLSLPDSALLAGMIKQPMYYSPLKHPDWAMERRNAVLEMMKADGVLTAEQATAAEAEPLGTRLQ